MQAKPDRERYSAREFCHEPFEDLLSYHFFSSFFPPPSPPSAVLRAIRRIRHYRAALSSCTAVKYEAALAHYTNAGAWSKDRLEHGACETEYGYMETIADAASRAVATCGSFRETIKSSPWAAPVREVLGASLSLRSLTGELLVIKDSQFQNWNGTESLLARGVSFWANATGAYGSPYQIDLRANGDAGHGGFSSTTRRPGTSAGAPSRRGTTVTKTDGTATSKRIVHVTREGRDRVVHTSAWRTIRS
jgi:hypothetical protein